MTDYSIKDHCQVNTNMDVDSFVGVVCENDRVSVHFPLGFRLSDKEEELRKDIILLLDTIASTVGRQESKILKEHKQFTEVGIPIQAYLYVISDYYDRGYYKEREPRYKIADRGKISWTRTIKSQKPSIQDSNAYYLKFVTRTNSPVDNELITLIHEYCVYESFRRIGWLFTSFVPQKPEMKFNKRLFRSVILNKTYSTFNDRNRQLFTNMLAIIDEMQDSDETVSFRYGTYRFEYVWETLVDRVFGSLDKNEYFPRTEWVLSDEGRTMSKLEPDSIMKRGRDVFVLDAKYYKYGASKQVKDLPGTSSISKQIIYGEYAARVLAEKDEGAKVYNAFLMPFDSKAWSTENQMLRIGEAISNWKESSDSFERVQGILVDIKYLMKCFTHLNSVEIEKLANCIINGGNYDY